MEKSLKKIFKNLLKNCVRWWATALSGKRGLLATPTEAFKSDDDEGHLSLTRGRGRVVIPYDRRGPKRGQQAEPCKKC